MVNKSFNSTKYFLKVFTILVILVTLSVPNLSSAAIDEPDATTKNATSITAQSAVLNARVDGNGSSTYAWFEYGEDKYFDNSTFEQSIGSRQRNVDIRVSDLLENTTYYFRIVAENDEGIDYGNTISFRTDKEKVKNPAPLPSVTTNTSTNTPPAYAAPNAPTATSPTVYSTKASSPTMLSPKAITTLTDAILEGSVNPNGKLTTAWFEYGTSKNLENFSETIHVSVGSSNILTPVSTTITDLVPNTTYYFRMVTDNGQGTLRGGIFSFETIVSSNTTKSTEDNNGYNNEVIAVSQSQLLKIVVDKESISVGEEINFLITYNNTTGENMGEVVIRVELPEEIDFEKSDHGEEQPGNIIASKIDVLFPNESGSMKIKGIVNSQAKGKDILITTAVLSYATPLESLEKKEVVSIVNNVVSGTRLEANAISSTGFLPSTLLDWLILALVVLCIVTVARLMFKNTSTTIPAPKDL